jgi:hypothetical protein
MLVLLKGESQNLRLKGNAAVGKVKSGKPKCNISMPVYGYTDVTGNVNVRQVMCAEHKREW